MLEFKFSLVQRTDILLGSCLPDVQNCKSIASPCNKFSFRHFMTQAKSTYINREKTDRLLENKSAWLSLERLMELSPCRYHTSCGVCFPPPPQPCFCSWRLETYQIKSKWIYLSWNSAELSGGARGFGDQSWEILAATCACSREQWRELRVLWGQSLN